MYFVLLKQLFSQVIMHHMKMMLQIPVQQSKMCTH